MEGREALIFLGFPASNPKETKKFEKNLKKVLTNPGKSCIIYIVACGTRPAGRWKQTGV